MGSTAKKLMECNSLDDDFASDVKEFYVLLFFLIAWCAFFLSICISISFFFFPVCAIPWDHVDHHWISNSAWHGCDWGTFDVYADNPRQLGMLQLGRNGAEISLCT